MNIFWWIALGLVVLINYLHFTGYFIQRTIWNYQTQNKKIILLSKITFPSLSIITERPNVGFILRSFFFKEDDYDASKSFSEFWENETDECNWLTGIIVAAIITIVFYILIIVEWFYVILWQFSIKFVIWECWIKTIIWEVLIKGLIWKVLLSGNWTHKLK